MSIWVSVKKPNCNKAYGYGTYKVCILSAGRDERPGGYSPISGLLNTKLPGSVLSNIYLIYI